MSPSPLNFIPAGLCYIWLFGDIQHVPFDRDFAAGSNRDLLVIDWQRKQFPKASQILFRALFHRKFAGHYETNGFLRARPKRILE